MTVDVLQTQQQLIIRQRIRLMVNQYEIHGVAADGGEAGVLAFAQQKRMAFKEQVTIYTDDTKQTPLLGFKARQRIDLGATYDVTDAIGQPIGLFRKSFGASLLRSTWQLEQPGYAQMVGQETNFAVALLRRFIDSLSWLPYHFEFAVDGTRPLVPGSPRRPKDQAPVAAQPAFSVVRTWGLHDRYLVTIQDPNVDRRLVVAMAVALDALQGR